MTTKAKRKRTQFLTKRNQRGEKPSPLYKSLLPKVDIYTDGSASHTSKHGGWAYVIIFPDGFEAIHSGHCTSTTNNAMELYAAIQALKSFNSPKKIDLYSDSAYMVNALNFKWWKEWEKANWIRRDGVPTPNKELWIELIALCKFHLVNPIKVKAHDGDKYNDLCDKMAKQARKAGQLGKSPDEIRQVNRVSKRASRPFTLAEKAKQKGNK